MATKKKSGVFPRIFDTLMMKNSEADDLCRAAEKGDLQGFIGLLEVHKRSTNVNGHPPKKIPLHFAAAGNQPRIIQYIASKRGRLGLKNEKGQSALHVAVEKNNAESVSVLLQAGLDITWKDKMGKTALDYAWERRLNECAMILETWPFVQRTLVRVARLDERARQRAKKFPQVLKFLADYERKRNEVDRQVMGSVAAQTAAAAEAAVAKQQSKADKGGIPPVTDEKKKSRQEEQDKSDSDSSPSGE